MAATSLIKALDLISYLTSCQEGERLQTIVAAMNLPRPSVVRMVQTLEGYGLVEKQLSKYRLTSRFYEWSSRDRHSLLKKRYRAVLEEVAQKTGELVLLGIQQGNAIVHIDFIESDQAVRVAPAPVTRHDLKTSALGKLTLSRSPHLRKAIRATKLRQELSKIDQGEPAWNREESHLGVIAMATWGFSRAASEPMIAVAWPTMRFSPAKGIQALTIINKAMARQATH